jgi:hypothetical protein
MIQKKANKNPEIQHSIDSDSPQPESLSVPESLTWKAGRTAELSLPLLLFGLSQRTPTLCLSVAGPGQVLTVAAVDMQSWSMRTKSGHLTGLGSGERPGHFTQINVPNLLGSKDK